MKTVTQSNFDFLQNDINTQDFFETAKKAEENYLNGDFDGELAKVRKIAEILVKEILDLNFVDVTERTIFNDNLRTLKNRNFVSDHQVINYLYDSKMEIRLLIY